MAWRVAKSLEVLLNQVNEKWPNRSKAADGSIGDQAHASRSSDHNPDANDVVTARDFTNDPAHGLSSRLLAEALVASRDPRIDYVISNRQICYGSAGAKPWIWRTYGGANAHEHHCHVSVKDIAAIYDDVRPWAIGDVPVKPAKPTTPAIGTPLWLQQKLNAHGAKLKEDGYEGEETIKATRAFAVDQLKGK